MNHGDREPELLGYIIQCCILNYPKVQHSVYLHIYCLSTGLVYLNTKRLRLNLNLGVHDNVMFNYICAA